MKTYQIWQTTENDCLLFWLVVADILNKKQDIRDEAHIMEILKLIR